MWRQGSQVSMRWQWGSSHGSRVMGDGDPVIKTPCFFRCRGCGPKYWSFNFSISPSGEYSGLISFRIDWFDLPVQETLNILLQPHSLKTLALGLNGVFHRAGGEVIDEDSVSTRAVSSPSSALIPQWGRPSLHQLCPHTMCLWGGAARCAHTPGLMGKPLEKG